VKTNQDYLIAYAFPGHILLLFSDHPKARQTEDMFKKHGKVKHRIWLRQVKNADRHYQETGVWGAYDTARIIDCERNGKSVALFADTEMREDTDTLCLERQMLIEGRRYRITSVFAPDAASTPTDKLLSVIDADLEKEARQA